LKPEWWGSLLVQEKYQGENACDKRQNNNNKTTTRTTVTTKMMMMMMTTMATTTTAAAAATTHYNRSIMTDQTTCKNILDIVIPQKTIREAYLIDVATPNSHNLHSTITEKLQKYTDFKDELIRIWQLKMAYIIPLVPSTTGIILNKLH
jgi:hypothetical protein